MRWLPRAVGMMIWLGTHALSLGAQGRVWAGAGAGIAMPSGVLRDEANPGWRASHEATIADRASDDR